MTFTSWHVIACCVASAFTTQTPRRTSSSSRSFPAVVIVARTAPNSGFYNSTFVLGQLCWTKPSAQTRRRWSSRHLVISN